MSYRRLLLTQLLFSLTIAVFPTDLVEEPRRLLLYFEQEADAEFAPVELLLLYESLLLKLNNACEDVVILESRKIQVPPSEKKKSDIARQWGADSWIWVVVSGSMSSMKIRIKSFDMVSKKMVFDFILDKDEGADAIDLKRRFWDEVASAVGENYEKFEQRIARGSVKSGEIVIRAEPGTRIIGLPGRELLVGPEKEVKAQVPLPAAYSFTALCKGYYPEKEQFYMDEDRKYFDLDQKPGSRYALNFYLNNFNFPGFDLSYYFIPNYFFAKLGFTSFFIGLMLRGDDDSETDNPMLVSLSLTHLNLQAGLYLNREDSYFRYYLALGLFTRIILAKGYGLGIEPIAPFGIQPSFGMEFSRSMKKRLYLEYAPLFYLTRYPEMMRASFQTDHVPFNYIFLRKLVIDFFNFRIGLRLQI